jgi:hypothetical protein
LNFGEFPLLAIEDFTLSQKSQSGPKILCLALHP